jgi:plasmid stabilization system protein ParE
MKYAVERARDIRHDLSSIFLFLVESYQEFGEDYDSAVERAARRIQTIEDAMLALGDAPHQGTIRPDISPGLRSVTKDRAVFYYDVDDDRRRIRVAAVFYGGQDHQQRIIKRMLGS